MSRLQLLTGLSQEHSRPRPLLESSNLLQDSHLSLTENDENAVLWPLDPNGLGTETGADGGNQGRLRAAQSPAPPHRPLPAAPSPLPPLHHQGWLLKPGPARHWGSFTESLKNQNVTGIPQPRPQWNKTRSFKTLLTISEVLHRRK